MSIDRQLPAYFTKSSGWQREIGQHETVRLNENDGKNQNPVVGLRLPNRTSQGAFLATCFFSCRHQSDIKVRQLPSSASSRPKSACGHRRSQNVIRLVVTPALMETEGLWPIVIKNPVRVEKISALRPARFGRASWMPFPDRNYLNISSVSFRP